MTFRTGRFAALALACALSPTLAFAADTLRVPEGTEVRIRFDDELSSKTASEGDRFSISTDDIITLPGGVTIPAGYRGVGEVTHSKKRKMMGQAGELNVRFNYVKIGETRLPLRGGKGGEGEARVGTTITLTVLFGPLGLLKKGKDLEIKKGQAMTVFVDADTDVATPLAAAPKPAD